MIRPGPEPKGNAKSSGNDKPATPITVTKRGRPKTGNAMTNAQRQAKFKALKRKAAMPFDEWVFDAMLTDMRASLENNLVLKRPRERANG